MIPQWRAEVAGTAAHLHPSEIHEERIFWPVLHLSMHSFTPILHGKIRDADIGLLYDPTRELECKFCKDLGSLLKRETPFRVRYNYPYRGVADGFTTELRKSFSGKQYLGIEIEINQAIAMDSKVCNKLMQAIKQVL